MRKAIASTAFADPKVPPFILVDEITSALKEMEEETWKRAIGCVQKDNCGQFWQEAHLKALREEAGKEGVDTDCCGHKACCENKR